MISSSACYPFRNLSAESKEVKVTDFLNTYRILFILLTELSHVYRFPSWEGMASMEGGWGEVMLDVLKRDHLEKPEE